MPSLFSLVAASAVVFATTNLDDLLVLTAFFADREMSAKAIVAGQYVGIFVLTAGSVLAAVLALMCLPHGLVHWASLPSL